MSKEFCPTSCKCYGEDHPACNQCRHSKSVKYDRPIKASVLWYQDKWVAAAILGEIGDSYVVQDKKSEGLSEIKKGSPLVRKK